MTKRHELTDDQWESIRDLFDTHWKGDGRPPKSRRPIVNGIFFVLKTGIQWRERGLSPGAGLDFGFQLLSSRK